MKHLHTMFSSAMFSSAVNNSIVWCAGLVFAVLITTSVTAQTVINMPPPPMPAVKLPTMDIENITVPSDVVTWRERRTAANLAGPQRSYLGTVALTRYRLARSRTYNRYYVMPRYYGHYGNYGYQNYYPHDVSFLQGVPTYYGGYDYPWVGFGIQIGFYGTW